MLLKRVLFESRLLKDNFNQAGAKSYEAVLFIPATIFRKRKEGYYSNIINTLVERIKHVHGDNFILLGLPPFFITVEGHDIKRLNYFLYWRYACNLLLIRGKDRRIARTFNQVLGLFNAKYVYFTNHVVPFEKMSDERYYIEYLHGFGYSEIPIYGTENSFKRLSELIVFDSVSMTYLSHTCRKVTSLENALGRNERVRTVDSRLLQEYKHVVLFTLTHGYSRTEDLVYGYSLENGLVPNEFLNTFKNMNDVAVIFRFHQVHYQKSYKWARKIIEELSRKYHNFYSCEFEDLSLHELFSIVTGHVTMASGSIYEAYQSKIKSYSLCPSLLATGLYPNYLNDIVDAGYLEKGSYRNIEFILKCADL